MSYLIQFGYQNQSCRCDDYETATALFHALQKSYKFVRITQGLATIMEYRNG